MKKEDKEIREKIKIGILYLCIHKKLDERAGFTRILPKKNFYRILGETFHVPKSMRVVVLKEMEKKGLVKDLGNRKNNNIKVLKIDFDLENEVSRFYEWVGLYNCEEEKETKKNKKN